MKKLILLFLITCSAATITRSQSHIDSTFGVNGSIFTALDTNILFSCKPLIQSDGKIVLAGCSDTSNSKGYVVRYNPDGSIDSTFGVNGTFESSSFLFLSSIIQLSNGKLLLGGAQPGYTTGSLISHTVLTMLINSNGTVDTTFGTSGTGPIPSLFYWLLNDSRVTWMEELPSGKLLLYGTGREYSGGIYGASNVPLAFVMRYHQDGSIDTTFANQGAEVYYLTYPSETPAGVSDVVSYGSGRFMLGTSDYTTSSFSGWGSFSNSTNHSSLSLAVIDTSGVFDTSLIATPSFNYTNGIRPMRMIRKDSTLLIGGFGSIGYSYSSNWNPAVTIGNQSNPYALMDYFALKRYRLDGSIDTTFGTNNGETFTVIDSNTAATDMVILDDGRIIVVGVSTLSGDSVSRLTIARYTENGHLDSMCFDAVYKGLPAAQRTGPFTERTPSIVRVENNKILVASINNLGGDYGFQMTRYDIGLNHSIEASAFCEYLLNGETYNESGVYYDTLNSSNGCDSIIALELTIESIFLDSHQATACGAYVFEGTSYNSSGVYFDTLQSTLGCDSIIELDLTIYPTQSSEFEEEACDAFEWNGSSYSATGIYTDTFQTVHGCDSIVELDLTIHQAQSTELEEEVCDAFDWNGSSYSTSGIYTDSFQTVHGCDSIVELDLTINSANAQIVQEWDTLLATTLGDAYQWINCETGQPLLGDTTESLAPDSNGSYALVIHQNGCIDTSDCISIQNVGVHQISDAGFQVFPNPSSGSFTVQLNSESASGLIEIYSLTGQLKHQSHIQNKQVIHFDLSLASGLYHLILSSPTGHYTQSLIINE